MTALLAFDTSTERMSVGLATGGAVRVHEAAGGAQASAALLPAIEALLAEAGIGLAALDAIAFGRGPGAFTGLRTACAVAQGLALGADRPVLPIDSLLAVAEDARGDRVAVDMWVAMDARMGEIYAAHYGHANGQWRPIERPFLTAPEALARRWAEAPPEFVAGNALSVFEGRLGVPPATAQAAAAAPRAAALLRLGAAAFALGGAVDAALALPLYVRDKVADTTAEREAARRGAGAASERA